jgi:hypothetical protein
MAAFTYQEIGGMAWNFLLAAAGLCIAITGPRYLHLIDNGFTQKRKVNPEAAAKQVRIFRVLGAILAICCGALIVLKLSGTH